MRQDVEQLKVGPERDPPRCGSARRAKREIALDMADLADRGQQLERKPRRLLEEQLVSGANRPLASPGETGQFIDLDAPLDHGLLNVDMATRLQRLTRKLEMGIERRDDVHHIGALGLQQLAERAVPSSLGSKPRDGRASSFRGIGDRDQLRCGSGRGDRAGVMLSHFPPSHQRHPQGTTRGRDRGYLTG